MCQKGLVVSIKENPMVTHRVFLKRRSRIGGGSSGTLPLYFPLYICQAKNSTG